MRSLESPDNFFLDAATGWLMLGNAVESWREFEQIRPEAREHPAVVEFLWHYYAHEKRWLEAVEAAGTLVEACPDEPTAWIHRSFALHELRRTQEAFDLLLPAAKHFPKETTIPYNLACYTSQLGDLPAARKWFQRVLTLAKSSAGKLQRISAALEDIDLKPLWPELRERREILEA